MCNSKSTALLRIGRVFAVPRSIRAIAVIAIVGGVCAGSGELSTNQSQEVGVLVRVANIEGSMDWKTPPFSGDGTKFVTDIHPPDRIIWVYDTKTWKLATHGMHQREVNGLQLTFDGKTLFTQTGDNHVGIWDVQTSLLRSLTDIRHELLDAWFSPDGTRFLTKSWNSAKLQLWRSGEAKPFADLVHSDSVRFAAFDGSGARLITCERSAGTPFHLWDPKIGAELCDPIESDFDTEFYFAQPAGFDESGKRLVIAQKAGFTMVDPVNGKALATGHTEGNATTYSVRLSADGSTVVVVVAPTLGKSPAQVQIFDAATGRHERSFAHGSDLCAISRTGRWLFCGNFESDSTEVWDISSGLKVQTLTDVVGTLAPSPDGMTIAIGGKDKASIWRIREEAQVPPRK